MNVNNVVEASKHLTGFVIVMIALSALWGLTALVGRILSSPAEKPAQPAPVPVSPTAAAPFSSTEEDDDLVVVAAAAATLLDASHRIVAVRPIASSWGQQGRRDIHASHRIR